MKVNEMRLITIILVPLLQIFISCSPVVTHQSLTLRNDSGRLITYWNIETWGNQSPGSYTYVYTGNAYRLSDGETTSLSFDVYLPPDSYLLGEIFKTSGKISVYAESITNFYTNVSTNTNGQTNLTYGKNGITGFTNFSIRTDNPTTKYQLSVRCVQNPTNSALSNFQIVEVAL